MTRGIIAWVLLMGLVSLEVCQWRIGVPLVIVWVLLTGMGDSSGRWSSILPATTIMPVTRNKKAPSWPTMTKRSYTIAQYGSQRPTSANVEPSGRPIEKDSFIDKGRRRV